MTGAEAHAILDAARAGVDTPLTAINEALVATGDLQWRRAAPPEPAQPVASRQWPFYAVERP